MRKGVEAITGGETSAHLHLTLNLEGTPLLPPSSEHRTTEFAARR